MQLFKINATPVRAEYSVKTNQVACRKYPSQVAQILLNKFKIEGCTIENAIGVWQGQTEQSFTISIASEDVGLIRKVCKELQQRYNQDAVMLTLPDNTVEFI